MILVHSLPCLTRPASLGQRPFRHRLFRGWVNARLDHVSAWSHITWRSSVILQSILLALVATVSERVFGSFLLLRAISWIVLGSRSLLQRLEWETWLCTYFRRLAPLLPRMIGLYRII